MSLREEKKAATRRAISEATAALVLEEGTAAATVARVSERAGVSARTFHNYFADIDEALEEFLKKAFRHHRRADRGPAGAALGRRSPRGDHHLSLIHI